MAIQISPHTKLQIGNADKALTDWFNDSDQLRNAGFNEKQLVVLHKLCAAASLLATGVGNLIRQLEE